jgi:hypothetical protein
MKTLQNQFSRGRETSKKQIHASSFPPSLTIATPILGLAVLALIAGNAIAQSGGPFTITSRTIDGGGITCSTGGNFSLAGTAGQPDAGVQHGGVFALEGGFWHGITLAHLPDGPVLKMKLVGPRAVISWPVSVTGYTLQETTNLISGAWTPAQGFAADTATEHTLTTPAAGVIKAFRLKKQP